ncbi:MAG TPA: alpha/beta fold hydrolase [Pseudonocardia sp.]|nr:alpha/beta fold hydrolase [Pseudonocardia sp.]
MERYVEVEPGVRLWVREAGAPDAEPLLLVMGANASGLVWPDTFVDALAARHRVISYDHRDTGRSSWAFESHPYPITRLAEDAVAVLDALGIARAHVAGMSMGGMLVQLLLLDHPDRLLSATVWGTTALAPGAGASAAGTTEADSTELPGPDPAILALWEHLADPRDRAAELDFRVGHWRALRGAGPFDAAEFRALEERLIEHAGRYDSPVAHAVADTSGMARGAELADVSTPTLVIEAGQDPIFPPPHADHLAAVTAGARLVRMPTLGHALGSDVVPELAATVLRHTTSARAERH